MLITISAYVAEIVALSVLVLLIKDANWSDYDNDNYD